MTGRLYAIIVQSPCKKGWCYACLSLLLCRRPMDPVPSKQIKAGLKIHPTHGGLNTYTQWGGRELLSLAWTVASIDTTEVWRVASPRQEEEIHSLQSEEQRRSSTFQTKWYKRKDWLCGCDILSRLFCYPCLLIGSTTGKGLDWCTILQLQQLALCDSQAWKVSGPHSEPYCLENTWT